MAHGAWEREDPATRGSEPERRQRAITSWGSEKRGKTTAVEMSAGARIIGDSDVWDVYGRGHGPLPQRLQDCGRSCPVRVAEVAAGPGEMTLLTGPFTQTLHTGWADTAAFTARADCTGAPQARTRQEASSVDAACLLKESIRLMEKAFAVSMASSDSISHSV